MGDKIRGQFQNAKEFVLGREEPEPQGALKIFNCLPNTKSYTYAAVLMFLAVSFLFMSLFMLPMIILSPSKLVMFFSLAMLSFLIGISFLKGLRVYIKNLFVKQNLLATSVLLISLFFSLYFSIISSSYLLSLFFCAM